MSNQLKPAAAYEGPLGSESTFASSHIVRHRAPPMSHRGAPPDFSSSLSKASKDRNSRQVQRINTGYETTMSLETNGLLTTLQPTVEKKVSEMNTNPYSRMEAHMPSSKSSPMQFVATPSQSEPQTTKPAAFQIRPNSKFGRPTTKQGKPRPAPIKSHKKSKLKGTGKKQSAQCESNAGESCGLTTKAYTHHPSQMSLSSPTHGGKSIKRKAPAKSKKTPPHIQKPAVEQWRPPLNGFAQSEIFRDPSSFNQTEERESHKRNLGNQRVSHQLLEPTQTPLMRHMSGKALGQQLIRSNDERMARQRRNNPTDLLPQKSENIDEEEEAVDGGAHQPISFSAVTPGMHASQLNQMRTLQPRESSVQRLSGKKKKLGNQHSAGRQSKKEEVYIDFQKPQPFFKKPPQTTKASKKLKFAESQTIFRQYMRDTLTSKQKAEARVNRVVDFGVSPRHLKPLKPKEVYKRSKAKDQMPSDDRLSEVPPEYFMENMKEENVQPMYYHIPSPKNSFAPMRATMVDRKADVDMQPQRTKRHLLQQSKPEDSPKRQGRKIVRSNTQMLSRGNMFSEQPMDEDVKRGGIRVFSPTVNRLIQHSKISVKAKHQLASKHNRNLVSSVKNLFEAGMGVDAPNYKDVGKRVSKFGGASTNKKSQKAFNRKRDQVMIQGTLKFAYTDEEIAEEFAKPRGMSDSHNPFLKGVKTEIQGDLPAFVQNNQEKATFSDPESLSLFQSKAKQGDLSELKNSEMAQLLQPSESPSEPLYNFSSLKKLQGRAEAFEQKSPMSKFNPPAVGDKQDRPTKKVTSPRPPAHGMKGKQQRASYLEQYRKLKVQMQQEDSKNQSDNALEDSKKKDIVNILLQASTWKAEAAEMVNQRRHRNRSSINIFGQEERNDSISQVSGTRMSRRSESQMSAARGGLTAGLMTATLMKSQSVDKFAFKDRQRKSQVFTPVVSKLNLLEPNELEQINTPHRRGRNVRNQQSGTLEAPILRQTSSFSRKMQGLQSQFQIL